MNNLSNHELIEGWRKCQVESHPYYFPGDEDVINSRKIIEHKSFDEFIVSEEFGPALDSQKRFHVGLLPCPYVGNLRKASIFILTLNPGFMPCDYFAEQNGEFREALKKNLRQKNTDDTYPHICLNPRFSWHPGFTYWQRRLHDITKALMKKEDIKYQQALSQLAQKVACLELMPYHSKSSPNFSPLKNLPSIRAMLDYVRQVLVKRVRAGTAIIIAIRGGENWGLPKHKNIIVYKGKAVPRNGYLPRESQEKIAEHLRLKL